MLVNAIMLGRSSFHSKAFTLDHHPHHRTCRACQAQGAEGQELFVSGRAEPRQAVRSHSGHRSAAGERVRALHELGLYVCVDAAGQLSVPHKTRLHSQPTVLGNCWQAWHQCTVQCRSGVSSSCTPVWASPEVVCSHVHCMSAIKQTEHMCKDARGHIHRAWFCLTPSCSARTWSGLLSSAASRA